MATPRTTEGEVILTLPQEGMPAKPYSVVEPWRIRFELLRYVDPGYLAASTTGLMQAHTLTCPRTAGTALLRLTRKPAPDNLSSNSPRA